MSAVDAVAVVIPAHDEEELLGACLASVQVATRAAEAVVPHVLTVVVLDACTDASRSIAERAGVAVVEVQERRVGAARAAGVAHALASLAAVPAERIWTAHTDADSAVPAHWLTHQLRLARRGADVVIGSVRPDFADLSAAQVEAWWATHTPGRANGHVHGANLGVRADALCEAGGFPPAPAHEDVRAVERIRAAGRRIVASDAAWVRTSGRPVGRAPEGYATYLTSELVALARTRTPREISLL